MRSRQIAIKHRVLTPTRMFEVRFTGCRSRRSFLVKAGLEGFTSGKTINTGVKEDNRVLLVFIHWRLA